MDYQTLDTIADSYTPIIALIALLACVLIMPKNTTRLRAGLLRFAGLAMLLVVAYGLMLLDNKLSLWLYFGLDYSTHTAVALVLIVFLIALMPRWRFLWGLSLLAYCSLMLYQEYHSLSDILTTAMAVLGVTALFVGLLLFIDVTMLRNNLGVSKLFGGNSSLKRQQFTKNL